MPTLHWDSKVPPQPIPASLQTESLVYPGGAGYPGVAPDNRLVLGDNLAVMSALLDEFAGRVDLIYADPPFFTNRRFPARVGRGEDSRKPHEWRLAEGYPDNWADIDAYLDMLYPRLALMHRLLSPTGTLYLHLDWHANHYARLLLDEIFGPDQLLNEIVWVYHGPSPIRSAFNRKHDTILVYTKGKDYTFNVDDVRQPYDPSTVKTFASSPKAGFGKVPDLERGKVPEDWWYFPVVARLHRERTGYPTQKPEALLERIIRASSNPGDLVADLFCGSGTTPVIAERLGRRFLAADSGWRAIHTTHARLARTAHTPFLLQREARIPLDREELDGAGFGWQAGDCRLSLPPGIAETVDYWEVDPAWEGGVFRSQRQAARLHNKESLPPSVQLPGPPDGRPVCVRLVGSDGRRYQAVLRPG